MVSDCGCDGIEDIPFTFPVCCGKHLKESVDYARKQFKETINKIVIIPIVE